MASSFRAAGLFWLLVGLLGMGLPLTAQAWGTQGHQVVANLAQAQLGSPARREVERLLALEPGETLASISTADVHQPLHAGYLDDKGGNTYQLQAFMRGSNLHALWDSGLIRYLNEDTETMSTRLLAMPLSDQAHDVNVVHAAQESCRIVGMPEFYPERKVGLDYIVRFTPTMEQRLALAGARLAHMLNRAFK